jgi:hypothetical protein
MQQLRLLSWEGPQQRQHACNMHASTSPSTPSMYATHVPDVAGAEQVLTECCTCNNLWKGSSYKPAAAAKLRSQNLLTLCNQTPL